jgi:pepF/M3 family oligoendopeptidase
MEYQWNLDAYYASVDDVKLKQDITLLKKQIEELEELQTKNFENVTSNALMEIIKLDEELSINAQNILTYLSLAESTDSNNPVYRSKSEEVIKILAKTATLTAQYNEYVKKFENKVAELEKLDSRYQVVVQNQIKKTRYALNGQTEEVLANMTMNGKSAWQNLYDQLTSSLKFKIEIDGEVKELPISSASEYSMSENRETRCKAYIGTSDAFESIQTSAAAALNAIKGEALYTTNLRGYNSILDRVLVGARIDAKSVEAMFNVIKSNKENVQRYLKIKAKLIGVEKVSAYDVHAPIGKVNQKFTLEKANELVMESFAGFSQSKADLVKRAIDEEWIDYLPRVGKRQGAFCSSDAKIKQSRVLMNYNETINDVSTLAHELGHAYHAKVLADQEYSLTKYSLPLAETASNFAELLLADKLEQELEENEVKILLDANINSNILSTYIITMRYEFEDRVIQARKNKSLSAEELTQIEKDVYQEYFGDVFNHEEYRGLSWIRILHHFHVDYYNYPYAFGCLFARGLYAQYLKNPSKFVPQYDKVLMLTGYESGENVARSVGIDITKEDFWKDAMDTIVNDINKLEKFIN